jgi:UDP-N-acetylglucosamine acyltransferase
MAIHPTAQIDRRADLDDSVEIGPYVVIDGPVRIGARTRILPFAYLGGRTSIGADNVIHPGAIIGHDPQDVSYGGADTELLIGDGNVFREHSEVHRGSKATTVVGSRNYLMSRSHVGHDCRIADDVILATGATLGGHVDVEWRAYVSGNCVVHQFVRVGRLSLMRGLSKTSRDVPPFCICDDTSMVRGLNVVGLRRAGFDAERIRALRRAVRMLFRTRRNLSHAIAEVEAEPLTDDVRQLLEFIRTSKRGVARGGAANPGRDRSSEDS